MLRIILFLLGIISLILAFIGIFLPVLPTTPLVLLAAACFARSSVTFHRWLINTRYFGPTIRNWEETRTIPRKAKIISIAVLNFSIVVSIIFVAAHPWLVVTLLLIDFGVSIYILRIPTTESLDIKQPEQVENGLE